MSGSRWHGLSRERRPRDKSDAIVGIGSARSPYRIGVGIDVGIGRLIGCPSRIGLAHPPALLSTPLRLKIIFTQSSPLGYLCASSLRKGNPVSSAEPDVFDVHRGRPTSQLDVLQPVDRARLGYCDSLRMRWPTLLPRFRSQQRYPPRPDASTEHRPGHQPRSPNAATAGTRAPHAAQFLPHRAVPTVEARQA